MTIPFDHDKYTREANAHLQQQLNDNHAAFQGMPQGNWGSGPGQQPYFTPGAFRSFRAAIWTLIFGPVMLRIGRNWYERTGDWQLALGKATLLSAMWKVWGTAVVWWWVVILCIGHPDSNPFTALRDQSTGMPVPNNPTVIHWCWMLHTFVVTPALAVAYCQLVDKSMFKHRLFYRLVSPVHKMVGRIPWVLLISSVLLPIFFYIQLTVVRA